MKKESVGFLAKARHALGAAEVLLREGDHESAVGRAYYAMLHTAQALLRGKDLRYRKHAGVHAAFGEHFAKTALLDPKFHRWMLAAFALRLKGDYDLDVLISRETAETTVRQAHEFLETAERFLQGTE